MAGHTRFMNKKMPQPSRLLELTALGITLSLAVQSMAWAVGEASPSTQNPAGTSLALGLAIAYLSRRRKIGGWLLYFYLQLFSSLLVTLLMLPQTLTAPLPEQWDSSSRYVWYLVGTIPMLLAMVSEMSWGIYLLWHRSEANVELLKKILLALCLTSAASLLIDLKYFDDPRTVIMDGFTLFFAVIWAAYFRRSRRVRLVFIEQSWDYERQQAEAIPLTPKELSYVRKRASIVGLVIFVLLLLMMGNDLGDKKPEAEIFYVPLFYGIVAALLGRYLPISRSKKATLQAS